MHYALATTSTASNHNYSHKNNNLSNNNSQTHLQASSNWAICLLLVSAICLASVELHFHSVTLTFGSCILFVVTVLAVRFTMFRNNDTNATSAASIRAPFLQRWRTRLMQRSGRGHEANQLNQHSGTWSDPNRSGDALVKLQQFSDTAITLNYDQVSATTSLINAGQNSRNIESNARLNFINDENNGDEQDKLSDNVQTQKLAILLSSTTWSTAMAIKRVHLIPLQPVIMFINYTLLAHYENKHVFLILLVGNLLHMIIYFLRSLINSWYFGSSRLFVSNFTTISNLTSELLPTSTTTQVPDISVPFLSNSYNPSTAEFTNQSMTSNNDNNSETALGCVHKLWFVVMHLLIITFTYAIFHLIGLHLNRKNKADQEKSLRYIESYVTSKIGLDNEDKKLSKLMESVIPKHLAGKMREDVLCPANKITNFQPIYLTSYDNVSILFADIVNFTIISSNCSAQLLVVTLNELFGRFDKAADARRCLRIKILGDCYYCVSGIPDQEQAHAQQCVEMGLDMIDILSDLAQGDNQSVDLNMRVGINTGRVLCGVLGKKRWQFDVHSNDVKLANRTEQSGIPGRVHITENTLRALDGLYDVEPGNGHQRDTYIAQLNISTYFIIPPAERRRNSLSSAKLMGLGSNVSAAAAVAAAAMAASAAAAPASALATAQQVISATANGRGKDVTATRKQNDHPSGAQVGPNSAHKLQQNVPERRGQNNQQQPRGVQEGDKDQVQSADKEAVKAAAVVESDGNKVRPQTVSLAKTIADRAAVTNDNGTSGETAPSQQLDADANSSSAGTITTAARTTVLAAAVTMNAADSAEQQQAQKTAAPGKAPAALAARFRFRHTGRMIMNALHFIRTIDAPFANLDCQPSQAIVDKMTTDAINARSQIKDINKLTLQFKDEQMRRLYIDEIGYNRFVRGYRLNLCAFVCLCVLIYVPMQLERILENSHPQREPKMSYGLSNTSNFGAPIGTDQAIVASSVDVNGSHWASAIDGWCEDYSYYELERRTALRFESNLLMTLFALLFALATMIYAHQAELSARQDFIWRRMAFNDQERMVRVRDCNKLIFFNLLPPHVATYFLSRKNVNHMDLYHRSYSLAGVMFATVTNFENFYDEDQCNDHGLECLRVLNEIICDFDKLLEQQRFSAIDKIKTIGFTYMAAIGLFPDHELPLVASSASGGDNDENNEARKEIAGYLGILLNFINEMDLCLRDFNEHSYNSFKLRVGVHLGPVTAGVIGATKPQYDIWGNTVNVASRMESTCEPNKIQVTTDVYSFLKGNQRLKFTCRGNINVKGKGSMTTYYVDVLQADDETDGHTEQLS